MTAETLDFSLVHYVAPSSLMFKILGFASSSLLCGHQNSCCAPLCLCLFPPPCIPEIAPAPRLRSTTFLVRTARALASSARPAVHRTTVRSKVNRVHAGRQHPRSERRCRKNTHWPSTHRHGAPTCHLITQNRMTFCTILILEGTDTTTEGISSLPEGSSILDVW